MWTIQLTDIFGDKIQNVLCVSTFYTKVLFSHFLYLCLIMALKEKIETCSMFWVTEVTVWKYSYDLQSMYLFILSQCITTNICIEINPTECWYKFGSISIIFITNWKLQNQLLGKRSMIYIYPIKLYRWHLYFCENQMKVKH